MSKGLNKYNWGLRRKIDHLAQEADGVAVVAVAGEERHPALRPAPRRVEAPVNEHQRRVVRIRVRVRTRIVSRTQTRSA